MKPTEKQITQMAIDYCKKFVLKEEKCNNCPFYKQGVCRFQRDKFVSEHLIYFAITEWENKKEINTKERGVKIPNEKDLEFLAYALPWRLHTLLPSKHEDRDILIQEIISLWEKIRSEK